MKTSELLTLAQVNAAKTPQVRFLTKGKAAGAALRAPNSLLQQMNSLISLLQQKIDEGFLCSPKEHVLIYSIQPLHISPSSYYCTLSMVIKPLSEIDSTDNNYGRPLQLVINTKDGQVMNYLKGMSEIQNEIGEDLSLLSPGLTEELEIPVVYGNYQNHLSCILPRLSPKNPQQHTKELTETLTLARSPKQAPNSNPFLGWANKQASKKFSTLTVEVEAQPHSRTANVFLSRQSGLSSSQLLKRATSTPAGL